MTLSRLTLMCSVLLLGLAAPTHAAEKLRLEVKVTDDKATDFDKQKTENDTLDTQKTERIEIKAEVKNRGFKKVEGLTLQVYLFLEDPFHDNKPLKLGEVLTSKPFTLDFNNTEEIDFGVKEFTVSTNQEATGTRTVKIWYRGGRYNGWAAEVLKDGKVVMTEFDDKDTKKAYQNLEKTGELKH